MACAFDESPVGRILTQFQSMGVMTKEATFELLDRFYEMGGNFIDTANNYQAQQSEQYIGEFMATRGIRDEVSPNASYSVHRFNPIVPRPKLIEYCSLCSLVVSTLLAPLPSDTSPVPSNTTLTSWCSDGHCDKVLDRIQGSRNENQSQHARKRQQVHVALS